MKLSSNSCVHTPELLLLSFTRSVCFEIIVLRFLVICRKKTIVILISLIVINPSISLSIKRLKNLIYQIIKDLLNNQISENIFDNQYFMDLI